MTRGNVVRIVGVMRLGTCVEPKSGIRTRFLLACGCTVLCMGRASDSPRCFAELQLVNRLEVQLKVAHFDWLTHNLVTTLAKIIYHEVLGDSIVRVFQQTHRPGALIWHQGSMI
eukprot:3990356-Amphidinium_carterae.1